jgi:outer membrane receptor protein involved in Fe transport
MRNRARYSARLLCGTAMAVVTMTAAPAFAEGKAINIEPQSLATALREFASQSQQAILVSPALADNKTSQGVHDATDPELALAQLLQGTGLTWRRSGEALLIVSASDPQSGSAAGDGADNGTVQALIVTAQKREEDIQDVPIAISAFTQEDLTRSQVAGGPDLMTQVPNMTFTKTNFSSYSIQLRGIGTQAISATTDPAVAVAFNNTPFIRNRFFEQEFYDLQRVEVLRGPQGTLYGRNATAGVVNIISAKPKFTYEAKASADVANYNSTRLEGMVNVPLVEDKVALRLAGAWTKREGYDTNQITGNQIDGRDLWSTRLSLRFSPSDKIDANLIWEHFQEDDDRLRSGKQLCHTDEVTEVAGFATDHFQTLPEYGQSGLFSGVQGSFSQGCAPASLYAPESFQTPNGIALPYYLPLGAVFLPTALTDPYVSRGQSHDLRVIESTVDPEYRARTDLAELQVSIDLGNSLTLSSETAVLADTVFSTQDYNRFNTAPGAWRDLVPGDLAYREGVINDGVFCDPQIGCSDRLVAVDLSTAKSRHFSQEFRLASDFDGPFNFSLGANFLRYDTEDKYYVFINSLSIIAAVAPYGVSGVLSPYVGGVTDNSECLQNGAIAPNPQAGQPILRCTYIDPNPIGSLNDKGHNYFLSRNPYKLISYAAFGEAYYNLADNLKITAGLRWTVDKKEAPLIPSWIVASDTVGYPVAEVVEQEWREPTGRLTIDWKPALSFTDETLLYASYAHGYKAGGANPPTYGKAIYSGGEVADILIHQSAVHPKTFDPEFVDAFEVGAKNTLLDSRLTLNLSAFYYDYAGYQISQIVDRSASNLNYDATVWGLEVEADWRPLENLRLGFKGGYERTRVADGEKAIDIMDRTAGNPHWVLTRPFPSIPSNCILPEWLLIGHESITLEGGPSPINPQLVNVGGKGGGQLGGCELAYIVGNDPATGAPYTPYPYDAPGIQNGEFIRSDIDYAAWSTDMADYPCWPEGEPLGNRYPGVNPECLAALSNNGEGIFKDLGGKELPNAPHFTATITADYTVPLPSSWLMTLHTDLYYQSEAWTRIFNTEGYDKLKAYTNVNLAAIFSNEDAGWKIMAYVKNVFDRDSITGSFLNSDDTGLTTNVFLTEPRLYGLRVTKDWNGGPWWTGAGAGHSGPYPLTIEIGGQVQRQDAPYEAMKPDFASAVSPGLDIFQATQNRDLDWGDGRDLKVTYRPTGAWTVSASVRYGKTNGSAPHVRAEEETDPACAFAGPFAYVCPKYAAEPPDSPYYGFKKMLSGTSKLNWADAAADGHEEHQFIDFDVGHDVMLGGLSASAFSVGLRYAQFNSTTDVAFDSIPDWNIQDGWLAKYPATHHRYRTELNAKREFDGAGAVASWSAAYKLLGGEDIGGVAIDWSVGGGVLFGKQKTVISGTADESFYQIAGLLVPGNWFAPTSSEPTAQISIPRSKSVSVPLVDLSLGLSYEIQRVKIGAGYRWERYFNAIDGGYSEHKSEDRTFDGPYFKIAVGFGG